MGEAPVEIPPEQPSFGGKSSVVAAEKVQSFSRVKPEKTTELSDDDWRFEIKRKKRTAGRKNSGSTAKQDWYYWCIRIHTDGRIVYYGTLDILDAANPERLHKYWKRSKARKNGKRT